jgi:hypothetical protein
MPVEIRELVIKVNIVENSNNTTGLGAKELLDLKKQIVKECTEKVISKLEKRRER